MIKKGLIYIEFLYFKTFVQVVNSGSYTRAAIELDYAQSSVTNHIQKLEELYGGNVLLERKGKYMKPTSSGELLFDYAKKILALHQESHLALKEQEIKTLSIGTIETLAIYFLPELLEKFKRIYPNIHIRIIPDSEKNIIRMVKEKEIDFGLILDFPCQVTGIESLNIKKQDMMIVVPHDHVFASKTEVAINDLENETFILTDEGCTYRAFLLERFKMENISHNISMELSSVETIKKAVENKWGISFLPLFSVEKNVNNRSIKAIPLHDKNLNFYSQLLYRKEKSILKVFQTFINLFETSN